MKKMIFGGICFLGGLLLMLVEPSIYDAGAINILIKIIITAFTVFGFVLSVIGFVKKDDNENK